MSQNRENNKPRLHWNGKGEEGGNHNCKLPYNLSFNYIHQCTKNVGAQGNFFAEKFTAETEFMCLN